MSGPTKPSSPTRDWRAQSRPSGPSRTGRWVKRVFWSVVLLLLVGLFAWLLWRPSPPAVQLAVLPITGYDIPLAPVPFSPADEAEFNRAFPEPKPVILKNLQESDDVKNRLYDELQRLPALSGVNLILYVSAQGVSGSTDAKPYVLCNDYFRSQQGPADRGRCELETILRQVQECQAKTKLVLLDCSHIPSDPRLGMVVNDFPRLVEGAVKKTQDPDLWVLASNGPLEISRISYAKRRSVFAHFVSEGFRGKADRNEDGGVDLAEFYAFIRDRVADHVERQGGGKETQEPLLFHGGQGSVTEPPSRFLFRVPPKGSEDENAAEAPAKEKEPALPPKKSGAGSERVEAAKEQAALAKENSAAAAEKPDAPKDASVTSQEKPEVAKEKADVPKEKTEAAKAKAETPKEKAALAKEKSEPVPDKAPAAEKTPEEAAGAAPSLAAGKARGLLRAAWRRRDQLQNREGAGNWAPVDYAPHLWREYQELILGHELRYRLGTGTEGNLAELEVLGEEGVPAAGFDTRKIRGRLLEAQRRFLADEAVARFKQLPEDRRIVLEQAIKLRNELLFAAPYYVRWCARSALVSPGSPVPSGEISELVSERLPDFLAWWEKREEDLRPGGTPGSYPEVLEELRKKTDELKRLRGKIEDGLRQSARESLRLAGQPLKDGMPPRVASRIESLLSTPLLPADTRMELLDALGKQGAPADAAPAAKGQSAGGTPSRSRERWEAVYQQARRELQLVGLADPDRFPPDGIEKLLGSLRDNPGQWTALGALGKELEAFYRGLPDRVFEGLGPEEAVKVTRTLRLLHTIDARDVTVHASRLTPEVEKRMTSVVLPRDPLPPLPKKILVLEGPKAPVDLKPDNTWAPFAVTARTVGVASAGALLTLDYDDTKLEIRDGERKSAIPARKPWNVSLDQSGKKLPFEARPIGIPEWTSSSVKLLARPESAPVSQEIPQEIQLRLPVEDKVDLVVHRIADPAGKKVPAAESKQGGQEGVVACPVFPNRESAYVFSLKNLSGKARKVTVRFWAAPELSPEDRLAGRDPSRVSEPPPDRALTEPVTVDLRAGRTLEPIGFAKPKTADKKEAAEDAKAAAEKPKPAADKPEPGKDAAPSGKDVSHGVLCSIRDEAAGTEWTKRIVFERVKPAQYLQPRASYNHVGGNFWLRLRPSEGPATEDAGADESRLRYWPLVPPAIEVSSEIVVEGADPGATIPIRDGVIKDLRGKDDPSAAIPPARDKAVRVVLTVDGYPRAFRFRVPCDETNESIGPIGDLREVRIHSPKKGAAFPTSRFADGKPLPVELQVDAPVTVDFAEPDTAVEVWLEDKDDPSVAGTAKTTPFPFYSDRQWTVRWIKAGPEKGLVSVHAEVRDFKTGLPTLGIKEKEVEVCARLVLRGREAAKERIPILLDDKPPEILRFTTPENPVPKGAEIPVKVHVKDLSGVARIAFAFVKDKSQEPDAEKDKLFEVSAAAIGERKEFSDTVLVPAKDAKPGRNLLAMKVWDRVEHSSKDWRSVVIEGGDKAASEKPLEMGGIKGQVYVAREGNSPPLGWNKLTVTLKELARRPEPFDESSGEFTFKDVPPGKYTVVVEDGRAFGESGYEGTAEVVVTAGTVSVKNVVAARREKKP